VEAFIDNTNERYCGKCILLEGDDERYFEVKRRLHGIACVTCGTMLTVNLVREYKKNCKKYSYCKNIGGDDISCSYLECGECNTNKVKVRERKRRHIFTYGV
jgi:hypothetical protein